MFHGSIVALITPMHSNGEIDYVTLRKLVDWHVENGTDAIVVIGTTGESPTLDVKEQWEVIRTVKEQAADRIPVIAGTGTNSTQKTIIYTRQAMEIGVDACLLVTPYYNKPTQEGLFLHYQSVADAVPIPQILYNVPGRTGCDLLPETVERLAKIPNIVGIKEGMPDRARVIVERCGGHLDVFSGDDITAVEIINAGGKGVISVAANLAPKQIHEMCAAALAGNNETAQQIHNQFQDLFKKLFVESNPIPVKWAMHKLGLIPDGIRLPLTTLSTQFHDVVTEALQKASIYMNNK